MGASWAVMGASGAVLGPPGAVLGPFWGPPGPSCGDFVRQYCRLGRFEDEKHGNCQNESSP
eukprot:5874691-Pyramimonas_sp.AAC.1